MAKREVIPSDVDFISLLWPRLMSVQTAARYLDCTPWHMEELCRAGALVAFKEGKRWAVDRLVLDKYVTRRCVETVTRKRERGDRRDTSDTDFSNAASGPYKTVQEAAEYLRVAPWAIAQAIRANDLPCSKIGKRFVIATADLDEFHNRLKQG